ncbi:MAG TPA: flagellar hook-basal body complex protein FliE [Spirochaetia bacterium]|nr:flagellar hook-basal body complex protein FliE [Spirochaetia bacterium]
MGPVNQVQAYGDVVRMARTDPHHIAGIGEQVAPAAGPERSFGDLLMGALGSVNDSQLKSMDLTQQMVTNPDSVNVHDVTIALAEANLALSMTKAIVDRALTAYREIINVR